MLWNCVDDTISNSSAYGFVYCTTNLINGRKYIGQHKIGQENDERYLGSGLFLKQALRKYGKNNFSREILEYAFSKEELDQLEMDMISKYDAVNDNTFYNVAPGAYAHAQTEETRQKISKSLTGITRSAETKKKMSECKKRENLSPETIKKISESSKGRKKSQEAIEKIRAAKVGKITSEETKKKISAALKGRVVSEETKANMSAAQKGHPKYQGSGCASVRVKCIETGEEFDSLHEADRKTGINFKKISANVNGKTKTADGFHFEKI